MAKRQSDREDSPYSKRQKISESGHDVSVQTPPKQVHSWKDLQRLLAFDQQGGPQTRQNIQEIKTFLDSTAYSEDAGVKSSKRSLLHEYLGKQRLQASNGLADLVRSWSFAAHSNDERLFSAIAAVLALFLKTTSIHLEFREHGNQLCRNLLEEDSFRLFERGLNAGRSKEHVISPCLRLLTEIVSYDGGAAAKLVWYRRDVAFFRLEILLVMRKENFDHQKQSSLKPSVRDNALRYLFANLRLQNPIAKAGILTLAHGKLARAIFQGLREDSSAILNELLNVFKKYIIADVDFPRNVKRGIFRDEILARIAALYHYEEDPYQTEPQLIVRQNAHSLLLALCASPSSGLLDTTRAFQSHGIDPADLGPDGVAHLDGKPDSGLSSAALLQCSSTLSNFLQGLRPYASILEEQLILAVFNAAPDALVDYFRKKSFSFEPKLTATWIGFSKFLISVIMLPLPLEYMQLLKSQSKDTSSLVNKIIEYTLPSPLSQKVLTRCLNQSVYFVTFFAVRIMLVGFQKFESLMNLLSSQSRAEELNSETPVALFVDQFRMKCPEVRHVIAGFRSTPKENLLLRESFSRLLSYYYRLIPQTALEERFDISVALSTALSGYEISSDNNMHTLDLRNLLNIAQRSPNMHWWHKAENVALSPFTTLLRLYCSERPLAGDRSLRDLLQRICEDNHILSCNGVLAIDVLSQSLLRSRASIQSYIYIDHCILQLSRKSVKYHERMIFFRRERGLTVENFRKPNVGLLVIAIIDQWSFFLKASTKSALADTTNWLASYLSLSEQTGMNPGLLLIIRDEIMQSTPDESARATLSQALHAHLLERPENFVRCIGFHNDKSQTFTMILEPTSGNEVREQGLSIELKPPKEDEDHKALTRWAHENILEIVLEGTLGDLTLCLCSSYEDIRGQALTALRSCKKSLKDSDWTEALQVYMLLGEVVETVEHLAPDTPFPYFAGVFAARCFLVLAEPLHPLYTKVNNFLHKGPQWKVSKLPSYWIDKILLQPPTEDNGHRVEMEWLLDFLIDGLRTAEVGHSYY